jgi:hypothetical protein
MNIFHKISKFIDELFVLLFYKSGKGNVSLFLSDRLSFMIPAFSSTNNEIGFHGNWKYREDKYGIMIRIYGDIFNAVNAIFNSFLGTPPVPCEKNIYGYPQVGYYGKDHRGYHLQYYQTKNYVEIVCVSRRKLNITTG